MVTSSLLRLVLVTPEKTLLDEPVESLRFPLYDGQIGILPHRAPLVGRLGFGELRVRTAAGERHYFIDGGFVQVKGDVVSLLTDRAVAVSELDAASAEAELTVARNRVARSDAEFGAKFRDLERSRRKLALARRK